MKRLFMVLLLAGSTGVFAQPVEPAQVMFDHAVRDEASGRFDRARLVLVTLSTSYSDSPLAAKARTEVFALDLFLDAREKQKTYHARAAFITYRTVTQVYPESPLAKQAEATSRALEPQSKAPLIRSIMYGGFPVSEKQIQGRFT